MPLRKYQLIENEYYHVYNRGHNKQPIFLCVRDYLRYLLKLEKYLEKHAVTLLAYCLMPNHIHFLMRQDGEMAIEEFIHRLHTAYTMYFNKKYERIGSVFQGRFKAKPVETDEYLLHISRYIHQNPLEIIRAQGPALNSDISNYRWSSYQEYIKQSPIHLCDASIILNYFSKTNKKQTYRHFVEDGLSHLSDDLLINISNGNL
jgi:putative transposase